MKVTLFVKLSRSTMYTERNYIMFAINEGCDPNFANKILIPGVYDEIYRQHTEKRYTFYFDEIFIDGLKKHPMMLDVYMLKQIINAMNPPFRMVMNNEDDDFVREVIICYRIYDTDTIHFSGPEHYLWRCSLVERRRLAFIAGFPIGEELIKLMGENSFAKKIELKDIIKAMIEVAHLPNSLPPTDGSDFLIRHRKEKRKEDWVDCIQWNI